VNEKVVCTVDGDNGLGLIVGPKANAIAMDKAGQFGSGWVSVCNTNHYGIASYYSLKALERDYDWLSMTNSTKLVAPLGVESEMLGTNPISILSRIKESADCNRSGYQRCGLRQN